MTSMNRIVLIVASLVLAPTASFGAVPVPGQAPIEKVDFERHLMGVFSKAGCNAA